MCVVDFDSNVVDFAFLIGGVFPLVVLLFLCGCVVSFILFWFVFLRKDKPPPYFLPFVIVGTFIMSVCWLYIVTNEMLSLLQSFGTAWGILPSVLAVTALTYANSLGDIVADVTVARYGIFILLLTFAEKGIQVWPLVHATVVLF
jgi:sodium/potassium/calcium exchanger 6